MKNSLGLRDFLLRTAIKKGDIYSINERRCKYEDLLRCDKNNVSLLEIAIENHCVFSNEYLNKMKNDKDLISYVIRNNKFDLFLDLFNSLDEDFLFLEVDGKYVIDYVLDSNNLIKIDFDSIINRHEVIDVFLEHNIEYYFLKINPELFIKLMEKDGEVYYFEKYIGKPDVFNYIFDKLKDTEGFLDILFERGYYDFFLHNYYLEKKSRSGKFYLEKFIIAIKEGRCSLEISDIENLSNLYLSNFLLFKYGFCENEPKFFIEILIGNTLIDSNFVRVLDLYLDIDEKFTMEKIIGDNITDPRILTCLIENNINLEEYGIDYLDIDFGENVVEYDLNDLFNYKFGCGPLLQEGEELLSEFGDLFYNDGISEKRVIDLLLLGFRFSLVNNYNLTLEMLKSLILIKKNFNDEFVYLATNQELSYFELSTFHIYFSKTGSIMSLLHETVHFLHFFNCENELCPDNYREVADNFISDNNNLKPISEFLASASSNIENSKEDVLDYSNSFYNKYVEDNGLEKIEEILDLYREKLRISLSKYDFSLESIDKTIDMICSLKNYKVYSLLDFARKNVESYTSNMNRCIGSICDILDAIYEGKLVEGDLVYEGNVVKALTGHGAYYYSVVNNQFLEIVAEYGNLFFDSKSVKYINLLRDLIGDELFEVIDSYYKNSVMNSKKTEERINEKKR